jgi:predicted membrane-bound mannosyltransferase
VKAVQNHKPQTGPVCRVLTVFLIVFGIALRLAGYLAHRSLWGDEVEIALNVRFRDLAGLMHPLDYEQTMPIPLLVVIKLLVSIFGASECVLRLPVIVVGWQRYGLFSGDCSALASL